MRHFNWRYSFIFVTFQFYQLIMKWIYIILLNYNILSFSLRGHVDWISLKNLPNWLDFSVFNIFVFFELKFSLIEQIIIWCLIFVLKVWDLDSNPGWSSIACKATMVGHTDAVRCLHVHHDKLISGSYDNTLKMWDMLDGQCLLTLR